MGMNEIRKRNRELMPLFTKSYDKLNKVFGPMKVIYVIENGYEVGQEDPNTVYVKPYVDMPSDNHDDWGRPKKR
jgi:hypothetical protein